MVGIKSYKKSANVDTSQVSSLIFVPMGVDHVFKVGCKSQSYTI